MRAPGFLLACTGLWLGSAIFGSGCGSNDEPASYVTGLRVLAIKAEPPEVPAGATSTLTALALDTEGRAIDIAWAQCLLAPLSGQTIHPDCITNTAADFLQSVGSGQSAVTLMPPVDATSLGRPDATGGVYLPIIARVRADPASLTAAYLLRLAAASPPNQNPALSGVARVIDGTAVPLDDANPLVVRNGDKLTLRATFLPGSVETYLIYDGDPRTTPPRMLTEKLSVTWFSTAGAFTAASSGEEVLDTVFNLEQSTSRNNPGPNLHLPPSGSPIDLWIVARDGRGGADYWHTTFLFE